MNKATYVAIEQYMLGCMKDATHDPMHIYRVLYEALDIAKTEQDCDMDVLIAACLLHDIGREHQNDDLELDHAAIGAPMARDFLLSLGWVRDAADHVADCVRTHRYRKGDAPQTIEAKIVFDADKLEATGAIGLARTLTYGGQFFEPLYLLDADGRIVQDGGGAEISSFFQEYHWKLKGIYDKFLTDRGRELAQGRQASAQHFYHHLEREISECHTAGVQRLSEALSPFEPE